MASAEPPAAARDPRRARLTKSQRIGLGLLLTIVGLALLAVLLPTAPGSLAYALPVAGVGMLALWVGGILMGIGSRS
jgi:hypothetical protein